jgi:pyruvate dehydrogenase E2 component (dihydrolipoamide acetyltransferase)
MPVSVTLPALGESVTEGTVTRWLKQEGDSVQADEPLLEISTDKVDTEIPAPASGTLLQIMVREDETVQVGAELAVIGEAGEEGGTAAAPAEQPAAAPAEQPGAAPAEQPAAAAEQAAPEAEQPAPAAEQPEAQQPEPEPAPAPAGEAASATARHRAPAPADGGVSVTLPALGESVTEGTVTRWLKAEGDTVQADEPLLEISTDKVDTEIPAPTSGTLLEIKVREDETVAVGAELAVIAPEGAAGRTEPAEAAPAEQAPAPAAEQAPAPAEQAPAPAEQAPAPAEQAPAPAEQAAAPPEQAPAPAPPPPPAPAPAPAAPAARAGQPAPGDGQPAEAPTDVSAYVTPLVRKLAAENDIDLSQIRGTGVGGRIRKQDVLDAVKARPAQQPPAGVAAPEQPQPAGVAAAPSPLRIHTEPMSRLRKIIAARMVESLHVSGQLTTVIEVDVSRIARLRDKAKADFEAREGVRLSFMPFFAKATVEALRAHPKLNASIDTDKGEIIYHDTENLGIAVDTERGLVVPVIHDAGDLSLAGIARKIADVASRTRQNKITPDELFGGTFTLTNTGSRGALFDTPIINQPQVGILCTGAVVKRPVVIDHPELGETIVIRSMAYLALTYDHRLVDGADAARFLVTIKQRLEEGRFEADLGI